MDEKIQLFILPFAGGNASSFNKLIEFIDQRIEVVTIEYSGRGTRLKEGYIVDYDMFIADVVQQIRRRRNPKLDLSLFGYSMGATIVYELTSSNMLDAKPKHIFYGARNCLKTEKLSAMDEDDFVRYSMTLGGFDEHIIQNKRMFKLFIHPLKDDYTIAKQYKFSEGILPSCDTTVFYCEKDTSYNEVYGWSELTVGSTSFYEFGENHFFIKDHYKEIAEIINNTLLEIYKWKNID